VKEGVSCASSMCEEALCSSLRPSLHPNSLVERDLVRAERHCICPEPPARSKQHAGDNGAPQPALQGMEGRWERGLCRCMHRQPTLYALATCQWHSAPKLGTKCALESHSAQSAHACRREPPATNTGANSQEEGGMGAMPSTASHLLLPPSDHSRCDEVIGRVAEAQGHRGRLQQVQNTSQASGTFDALSNTLAGHRNAQAG
jgi:hypothetical protein